jgi:hypothetical protein
MLDRKQQIENQVLDFIKATPAERRKMLSFGVEIEYQDKGDGEIDWGADYGDLFDIEAIREAECEYAEDVINHDWLDHVTIDMLSPWVRRLFNTTYRKNRWKKQYNYQCDLQNHHRNTLETWIDCEYFDDLADVWDKVQHLFIYTDIAELRERLIEIIQENCEIDQHDYLREDAPQIGSSDVTSRFECIDDQSVSGGEVRTCGGLTYDDVIDASSEILEDIEQGEGAIDEDCSYHVHIKLGDIHHKFGANLHRHLMNYVKWNWKELPDSVKRRLRRGNRWIRPLYGRHEKYSMVHFHEQGTIEFRLFGNVSDVEDAKQCLDFATNALAYAYRVRELRRNRLNTTFSEDVDNLTIQSYIEVA